MIIRKTLDPRLVVRASWRQALILSVLSLGVIRLGLVPQDPLVDVAGRIEGILGTAVSILTGFRVTSAYDRWWEARKAWQALVNESRTFARQVLSLISSHFHPERDDPGNSGVRRELVYGQIALGYSLKNHLRRQGELQAMDLAPFLAPEVLEQVCASQHVPHAILLWMARRLQLAFEDRHTEDFRHMQMDSTFNRMTDAIGAMDRIKTTVFPRQYAVYGTLFSRLFTYLLPLALVPIAGWKCIPLVVGVGFIFFAMDSIAVAIENPFENSYNDTPMHSLARDIEIQLREALGETELPGRVEAVRGFLF